MQIKLETITPERAEALLAMNGANRNISAGTVDAYARDMKAGRWQQNAAAILVSKSGRLLDGQHRLSACIASGVSFKSLVATGLEDAVMDTIDAGRPRSMGDRLAVNGLKYGVRTASAVNICRYLATGEKARVTPPEIMDFIDKNPGITDSAAKGEGMPPRSAATCAALHYIGTVQGYPAEADAFIETMRTGIPYGPGDPALALRERLNRDAMARTKTPRDDMIRACANAFDSYVRGVELTIVRSPKRVTVLGWSPKSLEVDRSVTAVAAE